MGKKDGSDEDGRSSEELTREIDYKIQDLQLDRPGHLADRLDVMAAIREGYCDFGLAERLLHSIGKGLHSQLVIVKKCKGLSKRDRKV